MPAFSTAFGPSTLFRFRKSYPPPFLCYIKGTPRWLTSFFVSNACRYCNRKRSPLLFPFSSFFPAALELFAFFSRFSLFWGWTAICSVHIPFFPSRPTFAGYEEFFVPFDPVAAARTHRPSSCPLYRTWLMLSFLALGVDYHFFSCESTDTKVIA